jgi:hypothetical protein
MSIIQNQSEGEGFNKRIHLLYENNLKENIERERNNTIKKVSEMQQNNKSVKEKVESLEAENLTIKKKIKRYRGLVQEQIDAVSKKKREDGEEIETRPAHSKLGILKGSE